MSADRTLRASILVIGDEILGGYVRDTNSGWLARRLDRQGVEVDRIVTVPDTYDAIDEALRAELARPRPRLVLTTGGIGSTPDDLTYEAIAASLDRELKVADAVAERIEGAVAWTRSHGLDVDDEFVAHMMRMARIPEGAEVLRRASSFAPGIRVDVGGGIDQRGGATIVILPGVPSQLRAIVTEVVEPDLVAGRGRSRAVAEVTHSFPESTLNRLFARLGRTYPDLRVGSYPGAPMLVRLRGHPEDVSAAEAEVHEELEALLATPAGRRLAAAWAERFAAAEEEETGGASR
ncbi:MAG: competence/damage-inducible protein A [Nitriliruptorales bacterium]